MKTEVVKVYFRYTIDPQKLRSEREIIPSTKQQHGYYKEYDISGNLIDIYYRYNWKYIGLDCSRNNDDCNWCKFWLI